VLLNGLTNVSFCRDYTEAIRFFVFLKKSGVDFSTSLFLFFTVL